MHTLCVRFHCFFLMMVIPRPSRRSFSLSFGRSTGREFEFEFVFCPVAELFVLYDVSFLLMFNLFYFVVRIWT